MQALRWGPWDVFAYDSLLHTVSPLLRWLYAESHAWEPWAITGVEARLGEYRYANVLYVAHDEREAWLDRIFADVVDVRGWARSVELRFRAEGRRLLRALRHRDVETLLVAAPRVLSVGVFKEVLSDDALVVLLGQFFPAEAARPMLPLLWQPRCLPHFLKFELRSLFAAERGDLQGGIRRAAHHSRFLLEDTPFHAPEAFAAHLEALGGRPRARRLKRLREHRAAIARADRAERSLLGLMEQFGRHTLEAKLRVHALLRFVRFVATAEELKHVLLVEAARVLRGELERRGLPIETSGPEALRPKPSPRAGARRSEASHPW